MQPDAKWSNSERTVVTWTNPDGTTTSASIAHEGLAAWIAAGGDPAPHEPSREAEMRVAFDDGYVVGDAIYAVDDVTWRRMMDEAQHVSLFGEFSAGRKELSWPAPRVEHGDVTFTRTENFSSVVRAVSNWRSSWQLYVDGRAPEPP